MDAGKTGAYLAALRKARGMTQQEAADQLGVSNKTVSKWENGAGLPDITVLPALAELYGVTADDILAGETLRGRPAEAQGPARRRLLLLRAGPGSTSVSSAAWRWVCWRHSGWPMSVWRPGRCRWASYGSAMCWLSIRPGTVIYRWMLKFGKTCTAKLLAASAVQWWALLRLVRLGRLEVDFAEMRYYDTMQAWKPLLFAVGLALLCAVLERALRRRAGRMPLCCGYRAAAANAPPERRLPAADPAALAGGLAWAVLLAGLWFLADGQLDRCWRPGSPDMGKSWSKAVSRRAGPSCGGGWRRMWHSGSGCGRRVLIAGAVSGAGVLVWTLLHWKKRRPPLAEEGET